MTGLAPLPATPPRRLVFLGTPQLAVPPLEALVAAGFEVVLVVTRPDARRGRGAQISPSPVKAAAAAIGIPVSHRVDDLCELDPPPDLGVVVAFGEIIKPHVLARIPMVNLHFSLLPRWRGAAPVERALLAGDDVTGVCLMQVEEGLDTGGVLGCVEVPISTDTTLDALRTELVERGTELLVRQLTAGLPAPSPQTGEATYAPKLQRSELRLDWTRPAIELDRVVRTGQAWTTFRGKRLKVLAARIVDDQLLPEIVQPEGKGPMSFDEWARGARLAPGEWFDS